MLTPCFYFVENNRDLFIIMTMLIDLFGWFGIICAAYIFCKLFLLVFHLLHTYVFSVYPDLKEYGKWSVVTGATDGIGKAIAFQLASLGQNIVVISRNEQKLQKVVCDLEFQHKIEAKYICADFSAEESIYDKIEEELEDLDVGILVNNAGMGIGPYIFTKVPEISECLADITKVNVFSVYKMHQIVLPKMLERKRGLIVNISSLSAVFPLKFSSIYGSTKSCVDYFSKALDTECREHGVMIQSCLPGFVSTKMTRYQNPSLFTLTATDYASSLVATFGKCPITYGCWQHAIQAFFLQNLPDFVINGIISYAQNKRQAEWESQ